jgi:hypothetical protein
MNEEGTLLRQALSDALSFLLTVKDEFSHPVLLAPARLLPNAHSKQPPVM